jgi:hypothetical protein
MDTTKQYTAHIELLERVIDSCLNDAHLKVAWDMILTFELVYKGVVEYRTHYCNVGDLLARHNAKQSLLLIN